LPLINCCPYILNYFHWLNFTDHLTAVSVYFPTFLFLFKAIMFFLSILKVVNSTKLSFV